MDTDNVNSGDDFIRRIHVYFGAQQMLDRAIQNHPEEAEEMIERYFSGIVDACNDDSNLRDVVIAVNQEHTGLIKSKNGMYCQMKDDERKEYGRHEAVKLSIIAAGVDLDIRYGTEVAKEHYLGCKDAFAPRFRRNANEQYGEITGHNLIPVYGEINVEKQTGKYTTPKPAGHDVVGKSEPDLELIMDRIVAESESKAEEQKRQSAMKAALNAEEQRKMLPLKAIKFC
jgi:hypothetical protein